MGKQSDQPPHQPVLYQEILNILKPKSSGTYIDGTLGAGGHAFGILKASQPSGKLIGFDIDSQALSIAQKQLEVFGSRVIIRKDSFANIKTCLEELSVNCAQGIILDLGVSSMQLDTERRGFSFTKEAPLDMRFNMSSEKTAAYLVNQLPSEEIADILFRFGEERHSRKIANAIIQNRPIQTTTQLAEIVTGIYRGNRGKTHPATRTFQALRIAVNDELLTLKKGLHEGIKSLCGGGRMAVISFHSLEDRIVKQFFHQESIDCICPPKQPACTCGHQASIILITRKPIVPEKEEIESNPRSRSAKLRVIEKI
jgi:16S rRNA (cytosine1402-N4)-methyltransferase